MIRVRWLLLVVLAAVLAASCGGSDDDEPSKPRAPAASADAATARELQQVLDLQRESYGATGMAAAIVIGGQHFWSGGSGLANRETEAPITAGTPFPIFSITKMFIAALAVKLAEDGRLKLDDPLSRALPDWPNADHITLRMLLNQTSGVGNDQRRLERDSEARPRKMWTPEESLSYAQREPHAAAGEGWEYNNANYVLAGLVIEHATRRPVADTLHELILDPLKLHDALLQPQERPPQQYGARLRRPAADRARVAGGGSLRAVPVGSLVPSGQGALWSPALRRWPASPTRCCAANCSHLSRAGSCCGSCRLTTATTATASGWAKAKSRPRKCGVTSAVVPGS